MLSMIDVLWFLQIYIIFKGVIMWVYEMSWVKTIPQWFVNPLHSRPTTTGYNVPSQGYVYDSQS